MTSGFHGNRSEQKSRQMAAIALFGARRYGRWVRGGFFFSSVHRFAITMPILWLGGAVASALLYRPALARLCRCGFAHPRDTLSDQPLDGVNRLAVDRSDDGDGGT